MTEKEAIEIIIKIGEVTFVDGRDLDTIKGILLEYIKD